MLQAGWDLHWGSTGRLHSKRRNRGQKQPTSKKWFRVGH
ncbi:hypothetical protein T458_20330 [Brevibacillus panacihumi W25]|uniref:Uncharacterized protein n=1 Tax=Brevibacillus panacihumi W25 TaxID=1408254 RepID=V6M5P4_9BACL|nr:hypothetical protein T458_20330 [Brevibacillus panacihumi W25]